MRQQNIQSGPQQGTRHCHVPAPPQQGLAQFVRAVALGAEAAGVGLCSAEVLSLLKEALLQARAADRWAFGRLHCCFEARRGGSDCGLRRPGPLARSVALPAAPGSLVPRTPLGACCATVPR